MNWLKRKLLPIKRALDKWLAEESQIQTEIQPKTKEIQEEREITPPISPPPATNIDRNPGINCPQCGHKFPVSIEILLSLQPIYCPSCNLKLELNKEKSKEALEAMEKMWRAINQPKK